MIDRRVFLGGAACLGFTPRAFAQSAVAGETLGQGALGQGASGQASAPGPLAVTIENKSAKEGCAEMDSVHLAFRSDRARKFRIEAVHPPYISSLRNDESRPLWADCNKLPRFAEFPAQPKQITFWETENARLVGVVQPSFWRKPSVPVRIGDKVVNDLHYVQYWIRHEGRLQDEVLVFYPADGNWRMKPLPPEHMRSTAYGSSFMIGPVQYAADNENEGKRAFVDLAEVVCMPDVERPRFKLVFKDGGHADVYFANIVGRCEERSPRPCLDDERILVTVSLSKPVSDKPFAAFNSMYATRTKNDVSWISWRDATGKWIERDLSNSATPTPAQFEALTLWAGRDAPSSRHNVSSPDMVFEAFEGE